MKLAQFSFSLLFPLLELVIWVILVLAPTTLIYMGLDKSPHSEVISTEIGTFTLSPQEVRRIALESAAMKMSHVITALNTPGVLVEALIDLPISWPLPWHRPRLPLDVWRSITLPFFCLPAWWFVGRGFDSLRAGLKLIVVRILRPELRSSPGISASVRHIRRSGHGSLSHRAAWTAGSQNDRRHNLIARS